MKAIIKDIHSPDILNLKDYQPQDISNFCFYLELSVGPSSEKGEETFGLTICTPDWLLENHKKDDIIFPRHYLIVFEYDYDKIIKRLTKKIQGLSADNWNDLALKISRIGYWEFEDYYEI